MNLQELEIVKENRISGESINQTKERLKKEGKFPGFAKQYMLTQGEDFTSNEVAIPKYKIIQPTCRIEGATQGTYRNSITKEEHEVLEDIVFLIRRNGRTAFVENDFSGKKLCWSYTGMHPAKEDIFLKTGEEPQSELCMSKEDGKKVFHCPLASWRNEKGDIDPRGKKPPICRENISFLGLDSLLTPFWILFFWHRFTCS